MAKKKRKAWKKPVLIGIFLIGLAIFLYPTFSNWYYQQKAGKRIEVFEKEASGLSEEERSERLRLARAYNKVLDPGRLADPFSEEEKEGVANYAKMLELHKMIGRIVIPSIGVDLPVCAGTSDRVLREGAGHLEGTSLPVGGPSTHSVITAHRGLPEAVMFRELDKLKIGDVFYFRNIEGVLAYQVDQVLTVEPTNFAPVLVQPDRDLMTLLTCTPYMINSHRLLVRGRRIPYSDPIPESGLKVDQNSHLRLFFPGALVVLLLLLLRTVYNHRKVRDLKRRFEEKNKD